MNYYAESSCRQFEKHYDKSIHFLKLQNINVRIRNSESRNHNCELWQYVSLYVFAIYNKPFFNNLENVQTLKFLWIWIFSIALWIDSGICILSLETPTLRLLTPVSRAVALLTLAPSCHWGSSRKPQSPQWLYVC